MEGARNPSNYWLASVETTFEPSENEYRCSRDRADSSDRHVPADWKPK